MLYWSVVARFQQLLIVLALEVTGSCAPENLPCPAGTVSDSAEANERAPAEAAVIDYKARILELSANDERLGQPDTTEPRKDAPELLDSTRRRAEQLGNELRGIEEPTMNIGHRITKWEYTATAYSFAAQLEERPEVRLAFAKGVVEAAEQVRILTAYVRQRAAKGAPYYRSLLTDLETNDESSRTSYLIALGMSIEASVGEDVSPSAIEEELGGISTSLAKKCQPSWNPWFKPYRFVPRDSLCRGTDRVR
jgi:hypothetical protein